jgi:hypothetical protein
LQTAVEPIDRPGHDHIELPPRGFTLERIEGRPLVPTLGAADAVVLIDLARYQVAVGTASGARYPA